MPAWIFSALNLIARLGGGARTALLGGPVRAALTGGAVGSLAGGGVGIPGIDLFPDGDTKRRRRRRRALTASDRADIAFIQATLGQAAGRAFAMLVVSRTTA